MMKKDGTLIMNVEFPALSQAVAKLGVGKGGEVQRFVTDEVARNLPDFMPRKSGKLVSGISVKDAATIHVDGPYARFLNFGVTASGKPVNYANGGPHWDKRMVAARGAAIAAKAERMARKKGMA